MTNSSVCRSTVLVVIIALTAGGACKKHRPSGDQGVLPGRPEVGAVDPTKLSTPKLFVHVPADTPYIVAAFEAMPLSYYAKLRRAFAPRMSAMVNQMRTAVASSKGDRWIDAITSELDGKWNAKGLESLGFSATPRFALYGLGLAPAVLRVEVKDEAAVLATFKRVVQKAGATLPPAETRDGRKFWRVRSDKQDVEIVFSIADRQVIVAVGPRVDLDRSLGLILGSEKPSSSMADGEALAAVMAKHGIGPHMVGYVDSKLLLARLAGAQPTPACQSEIDVVTTKVPRLVFGYTEIGETRSSFKSVLELAPELIDDLAALKSEVPDLAAAMADEPLFAFGGGVDLAQAQRLGLAVSKVVRHLGDVCQNPNLTSAGDQLITTLSKPLPDAAAKVTGALVSLKSISFARDSLGPDRVEAVALVASTAPKELFALAMKNQPPLATSGIVPDGKLHEIRSEQPLPFPIWVGVGNHAIVVAIGDKQLGDRALGAEPAGKAPLFVASYDYGKLLALRARLSSAVGAENESNSDARLAPMFGRAAMSVDVNDSGLVVSGSVEMRDVDVAPDVIGTREEFRLSPPNPPSPPAGGM